MCRSRTIAIVVVGILAAGVTVACTLNPQPLPPADDFAGAQDSDASPHEGGFGNENPAPPANDASATGDSDGGVDGSIDASDAGDASTDADAG